MPGEEKQKQTDESYGHQQIELTQFESYFAKSVTFRVHLLLKVTWMSYEFYFQWNDIGQTYRTNSTIVDGKVFETRMNIFTHPWQPFPQQYM